MSARRPLLAVVTALTLVSGVAWRLLEPRDVVDGGPAPTSAERAGTEDVRAPRLDRRGSFDGASDDTTRVKGFELAAAQPSPDSLNWLASVATTDPALGARAAAALGRVEDPASCNSLMALAAHATLIVRANAIRALGNSGGCNQAEALTKVANDLAEPLRVRQEAIQALAKSKSSSAAPILATMLQALSRVTGAEAEQLRLVLIQALGDLRSSEALASLEAYAAGPRSATERAFAAKYLRHGSAPTPP